MGIKREDRSKSPKAGREVTIDGTADRVVENK